MDFEKPDMQAFPCLAIARAAAQAGANAATILNAANEIAVQAFLDQRIGFTQIADVVEQTLNQPERSVNQNHLRQSKSPINQARSISSAYIKRLEK